MASLVSVVIPAYNGDRFIAETIESVLQQTYPHWELIVIDDGSTDQTQQIVQAYCDRYPTQIRYYYQQNQGVASARTQGIKQAQGEYIALLDQDDLLLPEKLSLQVACFESDPAIGMVHSGWRLINAQGDPLGAVEPWQEAPVLDAVNWIRRMPAFFSAMLFRRNWLLRVGELNAAYRQASDVDLIQRLVLLNCPTAWVKQVTVLYRQHDRNDSLNTLVQAEECWTVWNRFFTRSDLPEAIKKIERESRYFTLVWIAWRLYSTNYVGEAIQHLEQSLHYTPFLYTETILHWLDRFSAYTSEYGAQFDSKALILSPEWQQLVLQPR
ncbi:MAG TPA: glycosyltransferase family A protein [Trichocoleus sp.]|jgi:glycosyltransferase involved in cell wall biosynthesis